VPASPAALARQLLRRDASSGCSRRGRAAREGEIEPEDADAEIAFVEGDSVARAKEDVVEGAGIFAQRGFVVGAAIE